VRTNLFGGTSRIQYPKVPKLTDECLIVVSFVKVTRSRPTLSIMGAEIVTIKRRILAVKRRKAPTLCDGLDVSVESVYRGELHVRMGDPVDGHFVVAPEGLRIGRVLDGLVEAVAEAVVWFCGITQDHR
jgi:hypothetical protein